MEKRTDRHREDFGILVFKGGETVLQIDAKHQNIMTSGGDGDVPRKNPVDATLDEYRPSPILLPNYAGPQMRRMIAIVNAAVIAPAAKAELPVPSSSTPQHSGDDPTVSAVKVIGPPVRRCVSLRNIKIGETSAQTEIEISADDYSYEVAQNIVKKRRSLWKRTKRFFRRLVCCCA